MMRAVLLSQWRLALREAGPWITLAAAVAMAVAMSRGGATGRIFYQFNEMGAPIVYLMMMLFTAASARRERSEHVEELIGALPYEVAPWIVGRFLTHYLIWLVVSLAAWAAAGAAVLLGGQPLNLPALALNWAVVVPVTLAYVTALPLLIGALARSAVSTYFLTLLAFFAGPLSALLLSRSTAWVPAPLGEFFASGRVTPQGATGFFYNLDLVFFNRLFTAGIALGALALLLWLAAHHRRRPAVRYAAALLLAIALAIASAREYVLDWRARYAGVEHELAQLVQEDLERKAARRPVEEMPTFPVVTDDYYLTVSFDPWPRRVRVQGSFAVTNVSGEPLTAIPLTLRRDFAIAGVTVEGKPVSPQRKGDHLTLPVPIAPGETKRISAAWEGTVWQWRLRDGPKAAAHIAEESILLPAHYGWYPLPGTQKLTRLLGECAELLPDYCPQRPDDLPVGHPAARFTVEVRGSDLHIRHNGDGNTAVTTGLYLVGTPWAEQELHGLLVSASPDNRVQAERAAAEIASVIAAYEAMVPRTAQGPVRLIEVHDALYHGNPWDPTAGSGATPGALLLHGLELARFRPAYFTDPGSRVVLGFWWPNGGFTAEQGRLYRGFGAYMEYVRTGTRPGYGEEAFHRLVQVEEVAGRGAALQVLREMHALLPAGPTPEDFEDAVNRALAGALPNEKTSDGAPKGAPGGAPEEAPAT
ncbi:ABC-type transport system involved in multi-copper enzyme maturation permease subunit [Symbiobacterium terraclitae]|uniref:ABC-type transport system involved in multi-copper enzyme maturation permease subunit n=1 Tax=Symbiobacterium terraclitae TaxID=557451 RepID=A0ABS4JSK8_9FIRM|nr:hypothetical protein [Symbiobacterium terraclitae]MBP2018504.1 ABC-type transport system involved in multi-copper enzyme maturation permease subunit [Symbiobacterium terraclitae]